MLKRMTASERVVPRAWQHGFDLQVEAIAQRDADTRQGLTNAWEVYILAKARASVITKQEEDPTMRSRQVNRWEWEVEKLEGLLQEREELDDITLQRELKVLSTHGTSLDRRETVLEQEQNALEDAQILVRELDTDARDTELRDQEARLAARERQLVER
jgi:hypothetical protein